ncbi:MAG: phosphoribosylglycinamide formyltransferase [Pirellulaceae bacterium]|jgi:phosphoribosylglycinamide formyltransferase-1|nr:phosphoribosylglycinamide formyltransferase [Pirellulaceae bacterium]
MTNPLPVAVLISGGGRTLKNFLERIRAGQLAVDIRRVISSSSQAAGLQFAADAHVPAQVLRRGAFPTTEAYSEAVFRAVRDSGARLVAMAGFLKHVLVPPDFENRVTNIHPGLIPAFCGQGFYGLHVHQSALDYGVKVSGCTVHFVDNQYDHGPIILQRVVPVLDDDTPHTLADRVFAVECEVYPQALQWIAEGRVHVDGRRVRIDPSPAPG